MESAAMVKLICNALEEKKGKDIRVLDIHEVSVIADYFVIATGDTVRQVETLFTAVDEVMEKNGNSAKSIEGKNGKNWILLDYGDVVVHLFDKENRIFYDLERIWRDGKAVDPADLS